MTHTAELYLPEMERFAECESKILNVKSWYWSAELWHPRCAEWDGGGSQTHTVSLCLCLLPSTLSSGSPYDSEKVSGIKTGTGSLPVGPQSSGVNFGSCWGQEALLEYTSLRTCPDEPCFCVMATWTQKQGQQKTKLHTWYPDRCHLWVGILLVSSQIVISNVHCHTWNTTVRLQMSHVWNGIKCEQTLSSINDKTIAHHIVSVSTVVNLEYWCELLIPT